MAMYSISGYGRMIADSIRTQAYAEAMRRAINPDSVVLDIGTGIGIFAMLACKFGARRVFAIEPDDAILLAKEIAVVNGFADRIEFIQDLSTRTTLPEQVDVIVSDLRGVLPLFHHHIRSIADARNRFLAPGGVLIPQGDALWAVVVEAPDLHRKYTTPWNENDYGLDLRAAQRIVSNTWQKGRVERDQFLTQPQQWARLDYDAIESPDLCAEVTWTASRSGTAHGLSLWFDATLAEGVSFSNAPGQSELIYGNAFFPFSAPVMLESGDSVTVKIRADLVGDDYIWRWDTRMFNQEYPDEIKAEFEQSTFYGMTLSPVQLRKRASSYVPALDEDGRIDHLILSLMNGQHSLGEIARRVLNDFPNHFIGWHEALTRVGELSLKYSRGSRISQTSK